MAKSFSHIGTSAVYVLARLAARNAVKDKLRMSINPMQAAPRCTAKSKRTGQRCRAPAVKGWKVCRMHGARGGAPEGKRNGNYKHGARTKEMVALRKLIKILR